MGRIAEVEEVANLVVMLASPLMAMVNGTMIEIDGGQDKPLMDRFRDKFNGVDATFRLSVRRVTAQF